MSPLLLGFLATLGAAPLLLTLSAATAAGPAAWAWCTLGAWAASGPLYLAGWTLRRLRVRLPEWAERWMAVPQTPALLAATLPSFALYWLLTGFCRVGFLRALWGSLSATAPLVVIAGGLALTGHVSRLPLFLLPIFTALLSLGVARLLRRSPPCTPNRVSRTPRSGPSTTDPSPSSERA